jgi:polyhydroxybutyrate depolymerase
MARTMTWFLAGLVMASWATSTAARAEEIAGQIKVGGTERRFFAVLPDGAAKRRLPTVVVLHGALMDGRWMQKTLGMDAIARRNGVLAVYPDALNRVWNDGRKIQRRFWQSGQKSADDVAFLAQLTRRLVEDGLADPRRIYLLGVSNGGMMAFRMACTSPRTFAAVSAVIANMPVDVAATCRPDSGVPMLVINATDDPLIPWNGGPLGRDGRQGAVISTAETVDFWRRNNGCGAQSEKRPLPDKDTQDGSTAEAEHYTSCRGGAGVGLVTIKGGGHVPPGAEIGERPLVATMLGKENHDVSAAGLSWAFFRQFPSVR